MDDQGASREQGPTSPPTILDESQCWALLRDATVGRLAVLVDGHPDIFPVNYVTDHGSIVFRTATGTKLAAAIEPTGVAFEIDGFDDERREAWSVVARGRAVRIRGADALLETIALPVYPLQVDAKPFFVRLVPAQVTGRRFRIVEPERWDGPLGPGARAASE